jgi:hypothetical protein
MPSTIPLSRAFSPAQSVVETIRRIIPRRKKRIIHHHVGATNPDSQIFLRMLVGATSERSSAMKLIIQNHSWIL